MIQKSISKVKKMSVLILLSMVVSVIIFSGCSTEMSSQVSSETENTKSSAEETSAQVTDASEENIKIGLTVWTMQDTFTVTFHDDVIQTGKELGVEVIAYDNEGGKEVDNTRTLLSQEVDGAIMCYWDPNLAKTSIDLLTAENIPILAVDVPMPGVGFLGVNNYDVGYQGGEFLAQWIVDNWDGEIDLLVVLNSPTEGPIVNQRFVGQEDALLEKIDYPRDKIEYADCGGWAEGALQAARPILAKYPDAQKIAFVVENDPSVLGIITALEEAGKIENAAMVTQGVAPDAVHLVRAGKLPIVGGVAYQPEKYGEQGLPPLIEIVKLIRSGLSMEEAYKSAMKDTISNPETKEVLGQAIYVETAIVTSENIDQYYSE